jgi:Flp pilus assembly protein TadD
MPARARAIQRGAALQRIGRRADAEAAFLKAQQVDPRDPDIVYALAILCLQQNDWPRARMPPRARDSVPGNPQPGELSTHRTRSP